MTRRPSTGHGGVDTLRSGCKSLYVTLTERQKEIYTFILKFRTEHGCSPSIPELQKAFSIRSPNGIAGHLNALVQKGVLKRANRGSRNMDPVDPPTMPLYGAIPAGFPERATAEAAENSLPEFHTKPGTFALRVRGHSMIGAAIMDGDLVLVDPNMEPRPNQIVAALIDGESTLKRLVKVDGHYFLKAENPDFPELHARQELQIQGVVRAVIRSYPL